MTKKEIIFDLRNKGYTIPQICKELNISKGTVGYYLKDYPRSQKINNSSSKPKQPSLLDIINSSNINKENFLNILKESEFSIYKTAKKINKSPSFIKKLVKYFYIEIPQSNNPGKKSYKDFTNVINGIEKISNKNYNNQYTGVLKRFLFRNNIKSKKCEICNITEWNDMPISFELDHIDGDNNNNILSNLRILCPNCHSQTNTYKGRNINRKGA